MNTKTMRLPPRRVLTHTTSGASYKRKERDDFDAIKTKSPKPTIQAGSNKAVEPASSNQLLAGYLAHEYLTKGTLFGEPWDPARAQAVPVSLSQPESRKVKPIQRVGAEPSKVAEPEKHQRYVEVANLLKADGAHLPGIVNPTQLASFLKL